MFAAFFEGVVVTINYGLALLALTLSGLGLGAMAALFLFRKQDSQPQVVYVLLLGFGFIGPLAALLSLVRALNVYTVGFFLLADLAALALLWRRGMFSKWSRREQRDYFWIPAAVFFVSLLIRLGFLQGLLLPPFSDSAVHFEKVLSFTQPQTSGGLNLDVLFPYYHRNFHAVVAWLNALSGRPEPLMLAVAGHFFVALLPAAVYLMVLALLDGNVSAALFGALLASLGWIVPAHALNFGKYPTLMAVSLMPLAVGFFHRLNHLKDRRVSWWVFIGVITLLVAWAHSRAVILLVVYYAAYFISRFAAGKFSEKSFQLGVVLLAAVLFGAAMVIASRDANQVYYRYYFSSYQASTFLILPLLPFAFRKQSQAVLCWLLVLMLLMLGAGLSLPSGWYRYDLTLFDHSFFEITFFLPLTGLAILGLDGLQKAFPPKENRFGDVFFFLMLIVAVNGALIPQPWKPMDSSNYASRDDLTALKWISQNTPPDGRVLIAGIPQTERYLRAADAGVWVQALTGRTSIKVSYKVNWLNPEEVRAVCSLYGSQLRFYVYAGDKTNSFDLKTCQPPFGMETGFCAPQARIFILDCGALP